MNLQPVPGVRLAATGAGIRYQGRDDLVLVELAEGTVSAAIFTQNRFCAAPVIVARRHLASSAPRFLLINSGNANAGTGREGEQGAQASCAAVAQLSGVSTESVLPFSTGVIGEPLPFERIEAALPRLVESLSDAGWDAAARAIMTTDTVPKGISRQVEIDGARVTITGIAKGSGMIHPNMATMLSFIATDAQISRAGLQTLLESCAETSFNSITVDGDTSTNDACVLMATGAAGVSVEGDPVFRGALQAVFDHLAQAIVRDAEGATKFVEISVSGAASRAEAKTVAYTVATSPLVKTALFASDPNWGRILAAVGRAPVTQLDVSRVTIRLGDVTVIERGEPATGYSEAAGAEVMAGNEIRIGIVLDQGAAGATVWTSDLSHEYVRINAEYRT